MEAYYTQRDSKILYTIFKSIFSIVLAILFKD